MTEEDDRTKPEDELEDERSGDERSARGRSAEGGSAGSADTPPPVPDSDDDSPVGDTDQHSDSNA